MSILPGGYPPQRKNNREIKESTILYLIQKEVIQQSTECPYGPNSRMSRRKRRWRCTKKKTMIRV
ncbi:hypothetical protein HZS_5878 [Henneguya salminicola]|nr:hypothetical protein HZS_5878 [Henneguya salminicola]